MGLLSIFQRKSGERVQASPPPADASPDAVEEARTRARRRLIGAVVLVVIGVIGFPILFETQPRPIPVDIPIEIPRKEAAAPLAMPAARPGKPLATAPVEPAPGASAPDMVTESRADAGREVAAPTEKGVAAAIPPRQDTKASPSEKPPKPAASARTTSEAPAVRHPDSAATSKTASAAAPADSQRAQALLDGKAADKEAAKKDTGRFVVQVGAFSDASAARETRQKIEKLGLKTYTQVAETNAGSRIRVRVGPFASREDADRAQAKIKAAGSAAVVLTL